METSIISYGDENYKNRIVNNQALRLKYQDGHRNVTLREGVNQVISATLNIQTLNITQIVANHTDVKFLIDNLTVGFILFINDIHMDMGSLLETLPLMKEFGYLDKLEYLSAIVAVINIGVFLIIYMLSYRKQLTQLEIFYGFSSQNSRSMTRNLDKLIMEVFSNNSYPFDEEELGQELAECI